MNLKNLFITTLLVSACAFVFTSCSKDKDKDKNGKSRITVNVNENVAINLVKVDGGEFVMGATAEQESYAEGTEKPAHSVKVKTFYMAETEVTQELWKAVLEPILHLIRETNTLLRIFHGKVQRTSSRN